VAAAAAATVAAVAAATAATPAGTPPRALFEVGWLLLPLFTFSSSVRFRGSSRV
jgi:2-methylcitrate dehydratase PrpD